MRLLTGEWRRRLGQADSIACLLPISYVYPGINSASMSTLSGDGRKNPSHAWEKAHNHLLKNLHSVQGVLEICLALEEASICDLDTFLCITNEQIKKLWYCPSGPARNKDRHMKLKLGHRKKVQLLSWFLMFIQDEHDNGIICADVLKLTKESYNNFCLTKSLLLTIC